VSWLVRKLQDPFFILILRSVESHRNQESGFSVWKILEFSSLLGLPLSGRTTWKIRVLSHHTINHFIKFYDSSQTCAVKCVIKRTEVRKFVEKSLMTVFEGGILLQLLLNLYYLMGMKIWRKLSLISLSLFDAFINRNGHQSKESVVQRRHGTEHSMIQQLWVFTNLSQCDLMAI